VSSSGVSGGGGGGDKLCIPPASSFHVTSSPRQYQHNLTISVSRARSSGANGGVGGGASTLNSYPSDSSISSVHSSISQAGMPQSSFGLAVLSDCDSSQFKCVEFCSTVVQCPHAPYTDRRAHRVQSCVQIWRQFHDHSLLHILYIILSVYFRVHRTALMAIGKCDCQKPAERNTK
jgi:hypothetical protein